MDVTVVSHDFQRTAQTKWARGYHLTAAAAVLGFGLALASSALHARYTEHFVQAPSRPVVGLATPTLSVPRASQNSIVAHEAYRQSGLRSSQTEQRSWDGVATLPAEAESRWGGWVPFAALVGVVAFMAGLCAKSSASPAIAMLSTSGLNQKDEEAGSDRPLSQLSAAVQDAAGETDPQAPAKSNSAWLHPLLFTAFLGAAYHYGCPLSPLLPRLTWLWVHCVGGMLFGGLVVSSTLYESLVILQGTPQMRRWWFERVPVVDTRYLMPFLGVTALSGVCLADVRYGGLQASPEYVPLSLELLVLFGALWAMVDKRTQRTAKAQSIADVEAAEKGPVPEGPLADIYQTRLNVNLASCLFPLLFYWVMVAKPDFSFSSFFH